MRKTMLMTRSALLCALIIASTLWLKFALPGSDVMITTQLFFVLLCGFLLPPAHCAATLGLYLALGLMGLPVFSAAVGPAVVLTPAFGYLLSFPFASMVVSWLQKRLKGISHHSLFSVMGGVIVCYGIALPYIVLLHLLYLKTSFSAAWLTFSYCLAFLPLDIAKAILAALLGRRLQKVLRTQPG